jgi:formyltetrahydrofolate synthetase
MKACDSKKDFKFSYSLSDSIKTKIETICKNIYGAKDVSYSKEAEENLLLIEKNSFDKLPICMAKTQYSLSHDPTLLGAPTVFF